jgi:hypothetical protein
MKPSTRVFLLLVLAFGAVVANAQPSDAEIIKDLTAPKTVKVTLGKPGKLEFFKTYTKWAWSRDFQSKLQSDYPDIFVIVKGYIVYDVVAGKYTKWRTFTTSNSYEGLPDPTAGDVKGLIDKFGVEKFMGQYHYNHIVGKLESIDLDPEPKFEWHTPQSVSFNVTAVYTERTNDVGGKQRLARTFRIRLYSPAPKAAWNNLMSTPQATKNL